jgi:FkbM family methyltransferase
VAKNINKQIIFDFGANRGQNIPYYLLKSGTVVAIEGNPKLCNKIREDFETEIRQDRLYVENCVVTEQQTEEGLLVRFWISKKSDVLSTFVQPKDEENFELILVRARTPASIIRDHLIDNKSLLYCKFDLEGYDAPAIRSLLSEGIFPAYLSVEIQNREAVSELLFSGVYKSFMLIDGASIEKKYQKAKIQLSGRKSIFSFARHSAGPFGEDLVGRQLSVKNLEKLLEFKGYGWRDLHAFKEPVTHPLWSDLIWNIEFCFRKARRYLWRNSLSQMVIKFLNRNATQV